MKNEDQPAISPFGHWLKQELTKANMTPEQLGNKVGVSRAAVYFYFTDKTRPTENTLRRICDVFHVPFVVASKLYERRPGSNEGRF